ncbi:F0F1 ATP synthase subunit B [Pseudomonadota bacterium]
MNLTATIFGQIVVFAVLVWFIKAFLWKPMLNMLDERKKSIADGLAAAERGQKEQELSQHRAAELLKEAKVQAQEVINRAEKRGSEIVDEAKNDAKAEGERLLTAAKAEIDKEINRAREELRSQVATLVVAGAEQILNKEVDAKAHSNMLDQLATQL